jgi:hypothetical protein
LRAKRSNPEIKIPRCSFWIASSPFGLLATTVGTAAPLALRGLSPLYIFPFAPRYQIVRRFKRAARPVMPGGCPARLGARPCCRHSCRVFDLAQASTDANRSIAAMRWMRATRYIAPWFLGVFVLAQLSGIIPGHYEHAGRAGGGEAMMHMPSLGGQTAHHHSLADAGDECCAFHAMPALPASFESRAFAFDATPVMIGPERTLVSVPPAPLDPPPRLPSSI